MKKILLLAALLTLVLGGLLHGLGRRAEARYYQNVHLLAQQPAVRLLESRFERGAWRSRAFTSFELHGEPGRQVGSRLRTAGAAEARDRIGFRLEHEIVHGPQPLLAWLREGAAGAPVLVTAETRAGLDRESLAELRHVLRGVPALRVRWRFRSSGLGEASFHVPGLRLAGQAGAEEGAGARSGAGLFHGLTGEAVFRGDGASVVLSLESGGFEASGAPGAPPRVGAVRLAAELRRNAAPGSASAPWTGTGELVVRELALELEGLAPRLEALRLAASRELVSGEGGPQLRQVLTARLERLGLPNGLTLGPGQLELVVRSVASHDEPGSTTAPEPAGPSATGDAPEPLRAALASFAPLLGSRGRMAGQRLVALEQGRLALETPAGPLVANVTLRLPDPQAAGPRTSAEAPPFPAEAEARLEAQWPRALPALWGGEAPGATVAALEALGLVRAVPAAPVPSSGAEGPAAAGRAQTPAGARSPERLSLALAWREGRLEVHGEPLALDAASGLPSARRRPAPPPAAALPAARQAPLPQGR